MLNISTELPNWGHENLEPTITKTKKKFNEYKFAAPSNCIISNHLFYNHIYQMGSVLQRHSDIQTKRRLFVCPVYFTSLLYPIPCSFTSNQSYCKMEMIIPRLKTTQFGKTKDGDWNSLSLIYNPRSFLLWNPRKDFNLLKKKGKMDCKMGEFHSPKLKDKIHSLYHSNMTLAIAVFS